MSTSTLQQTMQSRTFFKRDRNTVTSRSFRFCVVTVLFLAGGRQSALGQDDPSTIIVPYSSAANRTIGDSVNILFPYTPLGRCVVYGVDEIVWDSAGAISSDGTIDIASSNESEKETTNFMLGLQTTEKIKAGAFNANSTFDTDLTNESFRSREAKSLTLRFSAFADYGRRLIQNYHIDPTAPSPTQDPDAFRKRCGTHFIRGERRASDLTVLVRISTSTQNGRNAIELHLKKLLGGGVGLKQVSGAAEVSFKSSYKSLIEFARKSGSVSVEYHAHGGPGIVAAGASAKLVDPADFDKMSELVSNVSSLFSQPNSSVLGYVLQSDTALGAPDVSFDVGRLEKIGALTRTLLLLIATGERYERLRLNNNKLYVEYFQEYADRVNVLRSLLVQRINSCAAGGTCSPPADDALQTAVFEEDMFASADVQISCQYQHASLLHPVVTKPTSDPEILESISINVDGTSHDPDLIDFSSTRVLKLGDDDTVQDVSKQFSGFSLSPYLNGKERRVFGTMYSENIMPSALVSFDNSLRKFIIDTEQLQSRRDHVLGSAFTINAPGPSGQVVAFNAGFPPRNNCPTVKNF